MIKIRNNETQYIMKNITEKILESTSKKLDTLVNVKKDSFNSDVYKVLSDLAFLYEDAKITITEDDWNDALAWFNDKFFVEPDID